jgi:NADP-dependent 3-hydroxy acid dehydrogenase YdfG
MSEGMERLRGKVALVTGASAGIGRAVAQMLAENGLRTAVWARRLDRLEELQRELPGAELFPLAVDLRDERQILDGFEKIRARWGGVDVLVNNAGLGHHTPLVSGETEKWRETLEVNVLGLCICTREAVTDMRRRGDDGHVVHVSSMAAHRVPPESGVYSASKYAVRALTEALRQELRALGSKVRISAVSPGYVETEFAAHYHQSEDVAKQTYGRFKVLEPRDIAEAVRFALASPPHMQVHDILLRPRDQPG